MSEIKNINLHQANYSAPAKKNQKGKNKHKAQETQSQPKDKVELSGKKDKEVTPTEPYEREERLSPFVENATEPVVTQFTINKPTRGKSGETTTINIIHTNDLHGKLTPGKGGKGGMAYVGGKIEELKKENPNYLLADGGDISYAPPYSDRNRFNPMPEIMNDLGYHVMNAGNHEFQWEHQQYGGHTGNPNPDLIDNYKELTEALKFPMVCANAVDSKTGERPDYVTPYIIQKVGDINVGVIGVVTDELPTQAHPLVGDGWKILSPSDSLNKLIPEMKAKGADIIVGIAHDDLKANQDTISKTHGIDIMLGGHDHQKTDAPISVKNADGQEVPLVEAGAYGAMVGKLEVEIDPSTKKIRNITSTLYPINSNSIKPDKEVEDIIANWKAK